MADDSSPRADRDPTEALADRLTAGLAALRAGRAAEAAQALAEVCDDPALAAADDLRDVRARALSLCGQALIATGAPDAALRRLEAALALAHELGDPEGIQQIGALRESATKALAGRQGRPPSASVAEIEARVAEPIARAELLIRKAAGELDAGRVEAAVALADRAAGLAPGAPRPSVLARLVLARARPAEAAEHLTAAAAIARRADEFTLVTAVARAAEDAGVSLGGTRGPDRVADGDPESTS